MNIQNIKYRFALLRENFLYRHPLRTLYDCLPISILLFSLIFTAMKYLEFPGSVTLVWLSVIFLLFVVLAVMTSRMSDEFLYGDPRRPLRLRTQPIAGIWNFYFGQVVGPFSPGLFDLFTFTDTRDEEGGYWHDVQIEVSDLLTLIEETVGSIVRADLSLALSEPPAAVQRDDGVLTWRFDREPENVIYRGLAFQDSGDSWDLFYHRQWCKPATPCLYCWIGRIISQSMQVKWEMTPLPTMVDPVKLFWRWVDSERQRRVVSYRQMEEAAGVRRGTISKQVEKQPVPTVQTCEAVARAFGLSLAEMVNQSGLLLPAFASAEETMVVEPDSEAPSLREALGLFSQLSDEKRDEILMKMRLLSKIRRIERQTAGGGDKDRKGVCLGDS